MLGDEESAGVHIPRLLDLSHHNRVIYASIWPLSVAAIIKDHLNTRFLLLPSLAEERLFLIEFLDFGVNVDVRVALSQELVPQRDVLSGVGLQLAAFLSIQQVAHLGNVVFGLHLWRRQSHISY